MDVIIVLMFISVNVFVLYCKGYKSYKVTNYPLLMQLNKSSLSLKRFFNGSYTTCNLIYDTNVVYLLIGLTHHLCLNK